MNDKCKDCGKKTECDLCWGCLEPLCYTCWTDCANCGYPFCQECISDDENGQALCDPCKEELEGADE